MQTAEMDGVIVVIRDHVLSVRLLIVVQSCGEDGGSCGCVCRDKGSTTVKGSQESMFFFRKPL